MGTRVVVFVSGGAIQGIIADDDCEVAVVDYDVEAQDTEQFDTIDGEDKSLPINAYVQGVSPDVQRTSKYFDLIEGE